MNGDIYFGGNTGCLYGTFSHCSLVNGNGFNQRNYYYNYVDSNYNQTASGYGNNTQTREATPTDATNDVVTRNCHRFWFYDRAAIGYVSPATSTIRNSAVSKALTYSGSYDLNAGYYGNTTWQCSKLVSRSYYDTTSWPSKIRLGVESSLIRPDDIYYDLDVTILTISYAAAEQTNLPEHAKERLKIYQDKGIDVSNISFQYGVQKDGIGDYFKEQINKGVDKKVICENYQITDTQLDQIIIDSDKKIL